MDIETEIRVIPPTCVEELLHNPRGRVFKNRGADHRNQKDDDWIMEIAEHGDAQYRTGAVNRAQRTVEESTVYQATFLARNKDGFIDPAHKAVEQEPEEVVFKRNYHRR